MTRAKKVSAEAFDYELQTALSNIRVIIDVSKTRVFANYQKLMDEAKLKFDKSRQNGVESSPVQLPRKVFPFDKELRRQMKCALTAKLNLYDQIGAKSHSISLKDYLYEFLDKEIKPIFPKGWMTLEVLKHRMKWIEQILPAEPKQLPHSSSQLGPQSTSQSVQSVQPSTQTNQISPQSQTNKVQTQQSSQEKLFNKQPMTNEKINSKHDIDSSANSVTPRTKSVHNSHQMPNKVSDNLSEGLVSKFMSSKETKNASNTSEPMNLTSLDLSTKPRSSPKPFNVPTSSITPMNLKTSPNSTSVKTNSSSPSISPMAMNSILSNYKNERPEKLSHEACLTKVIEQSLGDYPNSSVSSTSNQRNTKTTTSLPQTQLPFNEMFAKSFNNTPKKNSTPEVIEIASSPEPYTKPPTTTTPSTTITKTQPTAKQTPTSTPQQFLQQKASVSSSSTNYMRNSDASKKKYVSSSSTSLLHSSSAQKDQEMRTKLDQFMHQITSTPMRTTASDTSLTITPIQSKSNENSVSSSKQNSNQSSRLTNASSVITSSMTNPNFPFEQPDSAYMEQYVRYLQRVNNNTMNLLHQTPVRFMDSALFSPQSSQNIYFPYTPNTSTTSHRTGSKDK